MKTYRLKPPLRCDDPTLNTCTGNGDNLSDNFLMTVKPQYWQLLSPQIQHLNVNPARVMGGKPKLPEDLRWILKSHTVEHSSSHKSSDCQAHHGACLPHMHQTHSLVRKSKRSIFLSVSNSVKKSAKGQPLVRLLWRSPVRTDAWDY